MVRFFLTWLEIQCRAPLLEPKIMDFIKMVSPENLGNKNVCLWFVQNYLCYSHIWKICSDIFILHRKLNPIFRSVDIGELTVFVIFQNFGWTSWKSLDSNSETKLENTFKELIKIILINKSIIKLLGTNVYVYFDYQFTNEELVRAG